MKPLQDQNLLLIGIGFYDYELAIADEFRALGARVWIENEQPPAMSTIFPNVWQSKISQSAARIQQHHSAMLTRVRQMGRLDHVIVIKGAYLSAEFIVELRRAQPHAHFTAYHWDSMVRFPDLERRQDLFDKCFTFDHADAERNPKLILRPLFYRRELAETDDEPTLKDLCFVGWLHHDRLRQVEKIREQADALGLSTCFYLSTGMLSLIKLKFQGRAGDVYSKPQSFSAYVRNTRSARAIIDLPHPSQAGLTMRAIESIGANRKLITTNPNVRNYDFYHPDNIQIIDGDAPCIDPKFLNTFGTPVRQEISERYTLRAWALEVIGVKPSSEFLQKT